VPQKTSLVGLEWWVVSVVSGDIDGLSTKLSINNSGPTVLRLKSLYDMVMDADDTVFHKYLVSALEKLRRQS